MHKLVQGLAGALGFLIGSLVVWAGISILIVLVDLARADQDFPRGILVLIVPAAILGPALGLVGGVHVASRRFPSEEFQG
ncbi:MAG: hypothetical protein ACR2QO_18980 [Acidimicrobiales bacterium]